MFDTMKITKIVGFTCAALLLFLLVGWVGDTLYSTSSTAHGHGDEEHKAGYVIEVVEAAPGAEDAVEIPFAEYYAAADAAKGEKVFSKCSACHKLDGSDGVGPHLDGIVDASVARSAGYAYSGGMAAPEDRANLIAYLAAN